MVSRLGLSALNLRTAYRRHTSRHVPIRNANS